MLKGCFVTGTDTGIGKTAICLSMIEALKAGGNRVTAMKPVACGGIDTETGVQCPDAIQFKEHINTCHSYESINPYALSMPTAPVIAAKKQNVKIELQPLIDAYRCLIQGADVIIVEGVGGWHISLGDDFWMSDLVKLLNLPVIMVVGMRLGCINHAMLTAAAVVKSGCRLHGWVANHFDPDYQETKEVLGILTSSLGAPMLAAVPYVPRADSQIMATRLVDVLLPDLSQDIRVSA